MLKAFTLDNRSKTPLAQQVANQLKQRILRGELHHGMQMPSVQAVALDQGIDVDILEEAIQALVSEEKLVQKGKHYVVAYNSLVNNYFNQITPLVDIIRSHYNVEATIETLELDEHRALNAELKALFDATHAVYTRRRYSAGSKTILILDAYFPLKRFTNLAELLKQNTGYYQQLVQTYKIQLSYSKRTLNGIGLNADLARLLGGYEGQACYTYTGASYDTQGKVVEYTISYALPEIMRFNANQITEF